MATELTPCGALFETMKRYGGISHKDLARLVLSGRPLPTAKARCRVATTACGFRASSCTPPWARSRTATFAIQGRGGASRFGAPALARREGPVG